MNEEGLPPTPTSEEWGFYLFCFTRSHPPPVLAAPALDGCTSPIFWLSGDIGAVVCEVSIDEFCGVSAESRMADLKWLGPRVCRHEKVIEEVMKGSPVYPASFGTLFSSSDRLKQFVEEHRAMIEEWLDYAADKEEWGVKGFMDREVVEEHLVAEGLQTVDLPDLPGLRYLTRRKLRRDVAEEAASRASTVRDAVWQRLREDAAASRMLKPRPREGSETPGEMILNQAFLLARDRLDLFRSRFELLHAEYLGEGFSLELSGPWPPYHFVPR